MLNHNISVMKKLFVLLLLLLPVALQAAEKAKVKYRYQDKSLSAEERANDLLSRMTLEEKVEQISAQLLFFDEFFEKRDYKKGHVRNIGHFLWEGNIKNNPSNVAKYINEDTRRSIAASRWGIPVLQHGEALHGAQWGNATCFPQSIAMAASFDDELYYREGEVVAKELRAVGVRQVYAPVVNITRDQRWGRCQESYGEDVLLNSKMGSTYVKALETNGIVATPKHYVDNYGEGGHDSYASTNSWRVLREVYLEPFRACIVDGGARSIMAAYNTVDGVPASCSSVLLNDILRKEWGFTGYVVSDYSGVDIVYSNHLMADSYNDATAMCLSNGLDIQLANSNDSLLMLVESGAIDESVINESVKRVLKTKFELGLFDNPFVDEKAADAIVRGDEHRQLALECARKSMTLLKNNGILPLKAEGKTIGVYGPAANSLTLGDYSGGRGGWRGDGVTPIQGLENALGNIARVKMWETGQDIQPLADECDILLFFPTIMEEEGSDRSSFNLPSSHIKQQRENTTALIVDEQQSIEITINQEQMLRDLIATGKPVVVVLQNGSVIDISEWGDKVDAVLESWYPGEQGGTAIADVLTGKYCPGGRLPMSWAKNIGQNPMYYSIKPSGRGYGYVENDGKPLFPFGYGLSYTEFKYGNLVIPASLNKDESLHLSVDVTNTGDMEGDEVVQVYIHDKRATVARPMKELAAFKRIVLAPGETKRVEIDIPYRQFSMWDANMKQRVEEGVFEVWLGKNADEIIEMKEVFVRS